MIPAPANFRTPLIISSCLLILITQTSKVRNRVHEGYLLSSDRGDAGRPQQARSDVQAAHRCTDGTASLEFGGNDCKMHHLPGYRMTEKRQRTSFLPGSFSALSGLASFGSAAKIFGGPGAFGSQTIFLVSRAARCHEECKWQDAFLR